MARHLIVAAIAILMLGTAGCGGGGGGDGGSDGSPPEATATSRPAATPVASRTAAPGEPTPAPTTTASGGSVDNVQPIVVNSGPTGDYENGVFTTVTLCVPGSAAACQTISGVLVDTGSSGFRVLSSALSLELPAETGANNDAVAECLPFLDSFTWGPLRRADVEIAGEHASDVPIQMIGDTAFIAPPDTCTSSGLAEADTLASLGANGILGIGSFLQDCGAACAASGAENPGIYYACSATACAQAAVSLADQVQNPVSLFAQDNNGVLIELPSVPAAGAPSTNGSLSFGIGTHDNNALGSAAMLRLTDSGTFTTLFQARSIGNSFLDTGSNAYFFLDAATTGIPTCPGNHDFYCPSSTLALSATTTGSNGVSVAVTFEVANANALFDNPNNFAFGNVAGPSPNLFDWGLPFFLGRKVFVAIEGRSTPVGAGPYVAF